jgi:predicted NACHT family NTPase
MYNWKRFWCSTTGNIKLDYGGFLDDPESEYGRLANAEVVSFSKISHISCLILLGEPGLGKTTATQEAYKQVCDQVRESEDTCLWFNLGDYDSDKDLRDTIFRNETFTTWLHGHHKLHLFLDSLDEGLLSIKILVRTLKCEIENLPTNRLYFRITCRTSVWLESSSLEQKLKDKWKEASTGIYELAPLRRIDVTEAAQANGVNYEKFIQEILNREATPLAIKPVTLKFLLSTYSKNEQFPPSQKELYEQGCLQLCKEVNPDRLESGFRVRLNEYQRLIIAGRIAAVMIFANRSAIWTSPELTDMPNSDIAILDLCVGKESINQQDFFVEKDDIREVLSVTGLFSSRGTNRMGFAHQSYAEFLAAWYLVQHEIPLVQAMSLIVSPEDPERKLVPQLHETAAWLASMKTDILQEIVKTDPDVLLRSDIPTNAKFREQIVDKLLKHYDNGKLFNRDFGSYIRYKKLKHPGLAEQLRPYIQDSCKQFEARYQAIDIAKVCEVCELQEDLVNLALLSSQAINLRANAAMAICSIGDLNTRLKLKPLAVGELTEDGDDQLKGYSLEAVWPEHLTAEELFNAITPPKTRNFSGGYRRFLNYELVAKLRPNDLVIALNWVEKQGIRCFGYPFEKLADEIILKAWEHFDTPGVAESFAKIALVQWRKYQSLITHDNSTKQQYQSQLFDNDEKRRRLIEQVVLIIVATGEEPKCLLSSLTENILLQKDFLWMIEKIQSTELEQAQQIWAQLIEWSFNRQDAKEIDAIVTATQTNYILRNKFVSYFEAIELNSAKAEEMKASYLQMQEWENPKQESPLLEPPPKERVILRLEQLESGTLWAWSQLNMDLTLKPDSRYYNNELEFDLTKLPGWEEADIATRKRIIDGAKKYILEQDQVAYDWIGTNTFDRLALAGCRALLLLLKESPEFLDTIPLTIWQRWASVIVGYPSSNHREDYYLNLVKLAYVKARSETIDSLILLIDKENEEHSYIFITALFERSWDENLKSVLLEKVKDKRLQPEVTGQLLEELLKHGCNEAKDFAKSLMQAGGNSSTVKQGKKNYIESIIAFCILPPAFCLHVLISYPLPSVVKEYQRALFATRVLVANSDSTTWSVIWSVVQQDTEFGREVFEMVANRYSHGINLNITEKQLADFYIWLVQQYPHNEDPVFQDVHFVGIRESIGTFRNSMLAHLKERGTHQAGVEIQRIAKELPEFTWLKKTLLDAQNITRHKTWKPPMPDEILKLINNTEKRLVQDGNELLNVLLESLQNLQVALQGQTPAVIDLWNEIKWGQVRSMADSLVQYLKQQFGLDKSAKIYVWKGVNWRKITGSVYIPKDENRFSDYVARYLKNNLEERGVIVNREVEIRRGERTDIQIDAVKKKLNGDVYDSVTVIIEAKGCWNDELDRAMEIQLVNRYLKDNTCQHGIYLVGWFDCKQWDNSDSRKNKAPEISINEARENFEKQAEQLSQSGVQVKAFILNTALR